MSNSDCGGYWRCHNCLANGTSYDKNGTVYTCQQGICTYTLCKECWPQFLAVEQYAREKKENPLGYAAKRDDSPKRSPKPSTDLDKFMKWIAEKEYVTEVWVNQDKMKDVLKMDYVIARMGDGYVNHHAEVFRDCPITFGGFDSAAETRQETYTLRTGGHFIFGRVFERGLDRSEFFGLYKRPPQDPKALIKNFERLVFLFLESSDPTQNCLYAIPSMMLTYEQHGLFDFWANLPQIDREWRKANHIETPFDLERVEDATTPNLFGEKPSWAEYKVAQRCMVTNNCHFYRFRVVQVKGTTF